MPRSLAVSPDGTLLAAGGAAGSAFLVEYCSGRWAELSGHIYPVVAVQFSGDSRSLITAAGPTLLVWGGLQAHFAPTRKAYLESRMV